MKTKFFITALAALCFLFVMPAAAQRGPTYLADKAYASGDYYDAITLYKKAYTKEKNKVKRGEVIFLVGESYRHTNDYKNQELWYAKAIKLGNKNPLAVLYLANAIRYNGRYADAIVKYNDYKRIAPTDTRAEIGIAACEQAQKWKDKPTRYSVTNIAPLNTKYSDFGAVYSNKDHRHIIYTSSRAESMGKNQDGGTGEKFQDLFEASVDKKGKWSAPKPLLEPINSGSNEGSATLDIKGQDMYFTRCDFEKGKIGVCDIYYTRRKGQTFDDPKLIALGPDSVVVAQPSLSADEQTLYFVSNMPGGSGGYDIWMASYDKAKKTFVNPVNLGNKINTEEDEMFPFIAADGTLYFSSKGHIGMGGLDIFKSKSTNGVWDEPLNMKYPVNTSADDFSFVTDETGENGFLSSNRDGSKGSDDIYKWNLPPLLFTVSGKVYDTDTHENLSGVKIELFASDGSNIPYTTDKNAQFKFDLKPETDYKIVATYVGYLSKQFELSTKGLEQSKDFIGDFDFALKSTLKAIELPNILYDLAKWDLRPESKKSLDELVLIMNDNPTIVVELGSHTDSRPIPMSNDTLSQHRAESVVSYLIEKGIDPARLVAKGYGQHEPRTLAKDIGHFKKGDVMTDEFISALKTFALKEEAHQLNRRTEFKVIRNNFIKEEKTENAPAPTPIEIVTAPATPDTNATKVVEVKTEAKDTATTPKIVVIETPKKTGPGEIYKVLKDETYFTVAKKHGLVAKALRDLNGLKGEEIYEGMELKVDPTGDYTEFDKKFYILTNEKDDKKWKDLAKKFNLKEKDLKKLNPKIDEDQLRAGHKIRIAQ